MTEKRKQNAFVFYVRVLVYTLIALALRLAVLAPLACLVLAEGNRRLLALLSPVLAVLIVLPLRYSFAQAMMQNPRRFSFDTAFSFSRYGEKLKEGVVHALHTVKWGVPMALLLAGAYWAYTMVDALTLFETINDLGNGFAGLLGLSTVNNFMLGAGVMAGGFGLGALIWCWGIARNSANRYLWAAGADRAQRRSLLKGGRLLQLCAGAVNLLLWVPFAAAVIRAVRGALSDASTLLLMAVTTGELPRLDLIGTAVPAALAFLCFYLPVVPLRRWITAAYAARRAQVKAEKKAAA